MVIGPSVRHISKSTGSRKTDKVLRLLQTPPSSVSAPRMDSIKYRLTGLQTDGHRDRPIDGRHRQT